MEQKKVDFLGVGDVVTDAFIKLRDAWIENDNPEGSQELCMAFGSKLPYDEVVEVKGAGNSPNAALSATRLGLTAAALTEVGDDRIGDEIKSDLARKGLDTSMIRVHPGKPSNYHYVLRYKEERTILIKHQEYEYAWPEFAPGNEPGWIYLSSLGENSLPYQLSILDWVEKHPETKLAFQPGTFQMKLGVEKLRKAYEYAETFFCNVEEARLILEDKTSDIKDLLKKMRDLGPHYVCITDGPKGAYAYDGEKAYFMPIYPDPSPPKERTGCGDSFASTFTAALAHGKSFEEALLWAPINPMNVVQHIGAHDGLLTREKLEEYLANAPEGYEPREL